MFIVLHSLYHAHQTTLPNSLTDGGEIVLQKIVINGEAFSNDELYGIQRNALALIQEIDTLIPRNSIELLVPENSAHSLSFENITIVKQPKHKGKLGKQIWNHFTFPRYTESNQALGVDLTLGLPLWGCDVIELHDCIVEDYAENANTLQKKLARAYYIFRVKRAISRKVTILTNSSFSRKQIASHYKLDEDDITIIPCAWQHWQKVEPDETVLNRFALQDGKYFFTLGSRYAHKNFKWIKEAARQNPDWLFVVSGTSLLSTSDRTIEEDPLANVLFTGYISDAEVKGLMRHCRAYIQPSFCEGFGIPPMEAMSTGAKCIVSDSGSLPEIYANSVWYIDPEQYSNINLGDIMKQPIAENEKVLSRFSWEESAAKLWGILKEKTS